MTVGITTKKVQKYNKFVLVEELFQLWIFVRPVQKALKLLERPLIQKGGIYTKNEISVHSSDKKINVLHITSNKQIDHTVKFIMKY